MPLPKDIREQVSEYVLRDIAPGRNADQSSMDWFLERFNFVDNVKLQQHLAEAFYKARISEKLREAIGQQRDGDFNKVFIQAQIIHYASIYEALIDFALDKKKSLPEVQEITKQKVLSPVTALSGSTELIFKEGSSSCKLVTCKEKLRTQQLKEVQFNYRLSAAVEIGFIKPEQKDEIELLYKSRNNIHIIAAAAADFKPDDQQSSKAYRNLFACLAHARTYLQPTETVGTPSSSPHSAQ